jgi:ribose 5-phosphate isomerase B
MDIKNLKIYIGSDHAGFEFKNRVKKYVEEKGAKIIDLGTFSTDPVDYPDIAREVSEKVNEQKGSFGILVCGSGIGVCMSANKREGIRAADCVNEYQARMTRMHNHANVLCLGARVVGIELAYSIIDVFFSTDESKEDRHVRRVRKIEPNGDI